MVDVALATVSRATPADPGRSVVTVPVLPARTMPCPRAVPGDVPSVSAWHPCPVRVPRAGGHLVTHPILTGATSPLGERGAE